MTPPRRPLARGRTLAVAAAGVMLVACLLPWYAFAGDLPGGTFQAWDGGGVLVLAAALGVLAVVTLPAAAPDEPRVDRWPAYALLAGVAVVGLVAWPIAFLDAPAGLLPHRAPGPWLAVLGVVVLAVAARRIAAESPRPPGRPG